MESEIARIRQKILTEYEAAQRGLSGFASGMARHDFIIARTENISVLHEELIGLVGPDQAITIVANTLWSPADQGVISDLNENTTYVEVNDVHTRKPSR
jgi:hypothetical protein